MDVVQPLLYGVSVGSAHLMFFDYTGSILETGAILEWEKLFVSLSSTELSWTHRTCMYSTGAPQAND